MSFCLDKAILGAASAVTLTGIDELAQLIETLIQSARKPQTTLPPFLVTIEDKFRPGLSEKSLVSKIISRMAEVN